MSTSRGAKKGGLQSPALILRAPRIEIGGTGMVVPQRLPQHGRVPACRNCASPRSFLVWGLLQYIGA
jgi:hypothetical protein